MDKIKEIVNYLEELESILPLTFEDYLDNFEKRAACERYFEKIIEAVVDLAFLVIKEKNLRLPEEDESSFLVLADQKIISLELAQKLKSAKGMRNILAHEYGRIDDELVFEAITEKLLTDVKEFIDKVK